MRLDSCCLPVCFCLILYVRYRLAEFFGRMSHRPNIPLHGLVIRNIRNPNTPLFTVLGFDSRWRPGVQKWTFLDIIIWKTGTYLKWFSLALLFFQTYRLPYYDYYSYHFLFQVGSLHVRVRRDADEQVVLKLYFGENYSSYWIVSNILSFILSFIIQKLCADLKFLLNLMHSLSPMTLKTLDTFDNVVENIMLESTSYSDVILGFHITFADCIPKFIRYLKNGKIHYVIANELADFITQDY